MMPVSNVCANGRMLLWRFECCWNRNRGHALDQSTCFVSVIYYTAVRGRLCQWNLALINWDEMGTQKLQPPVLR